MFLDDDFYDIKDSIDEEEETAATENTPVVSKPSWLYQSTLRPTIIPWQNTGKHVRKLNPSIDNDICEFHVKVPWVSLRSFYVE